MIDSVVRNSDWRRFENNIRAASKRGTEERLKVAAAPCRGQCFKSGQSQTTREGHAARVSRFTLVRSGGWGEWAGRDIAGNTHMIANDSR